MSAINRLKARATSLLALVIIGGVLLYKRNLLFTSPSEPVCHPYWTRSCTRLFQPQHSEPESIKLVVIITTRPEASERRRVLRATWAGRFAEFSNISVVFIYGLLPTQANAQSRYTETKEEADQYKDLLVLEFNDTYRNLSLKSYLGFAYALTTFPNVQHILKADDDSFIFTENILALIGRSNPDHKTFYCYNMRGNGPIRNVDNIWFIPRSLYPNDTYPEFCSGHAYIGTQSAIRIALATTKRTEVYFPLEDVLFTGLAVQGHGVQIEHSEGWAGSAKGYGQAYSAHYLKEKQIEEKWNAYRDFHKM